MDELDKMIKELEYKFLQEKGAEGGTSSEFWAYVLAASDTDANLRAALLARSDAEIRKQIDEDPIPGGSVLGRQPYFTRLTEHVERAIQRCSITAPVERPDKFVEQMLREMPPPAGVTIAEAVDVILSMGMRDLAARHGCPEDVAILPWLAERGRMVFNPECGFYWRWDD
jgi:hypothetical protein